MLAGGELKYFKTEKLAHMSNPEPLKSIALSEVLCTTVNPKHVDMFVIDLGVERKVKLQAASEGERDAWVKALEQAKLKAWSAQEHDAFQQVADEVRRTQGAEAGGSGKGGTPSASGKGGVVYTKPAPKSRAQGDELLHGGASGPKKGCCVIS